MMQLQSLSYLLFFVLGGMALFLAFLPRLTSDEKLKAFVTAILVGPVVALFMNGAFSTWHDASFTTQGDIRGDDGALHMLAAILGLAASGAILWWAKWVSQSRSYTDFVQHQERVALAKSQAQDRARISAEARQERLLLGQVQLAKLRRDEAYLTLTQSAVHADNLNRAAALSAEVQRMRLAYAAYCSTIDPLNEQDQTTLVDGFRGEINRPRFFRGGKLDIDLLNESDDPLVRHVLHGQPSVALTPDD